MKPVSGYITFSRFDNDSSRPSISVSTRSGLTDHLVRALVRSKAAPGRLTQVAVVRPLRELHLAHDGRANEVRECRVGATERRRERRRLARERHQTSQQVLARRGGEAGADFADVRESLVGWYAHQERAETAVTFALAVGPAADDDLLGAEILHLDPVT